MGQEQPPAPVGRASFVGADQAEHQDVACMKDRQKRCGRGDTTQVAPLFVAIETLLDLGAEVAVRKQHLTQESGLAQAR